MKAQKAEDKVIDTWLETTDVPDNSPLLAVKQNRVAKTVGVAISSALFLAACSNGGVEVTATDVATEFARSQTPVVETYTPTFEPTATNTPEPTKAAPSMENLPSKWVDKIDRVETMTEMDGKTTRVVAIEKLSDEDLAAGKKPQLRALQWDLDAGEWIKYEPQVGLIGTQMEYWDRTAKSDELSGVELQAITAEPIYGKDGQEIKPGLVADFSDATLFCGDLIEVNAMQAGTEFIFKVTLATGDIELFRVSELAGQEGIPNAVYDQAAIDPSRLGDPGSYSGAPMGAVLKEFPQGATSAQLYEYFLAMGQSLPRRMLFSVQKTNSALAVHDDANSRRGLAAGFERGNAFDQENVGIILYNYPVMTEEVLNDLLR